MPHISIEELLERNKSFAGPEHVPQPFRAEMKHEPPHTIVISCFDPRSAPEDFFQIRPDSHEIVSIRNAGGHPQHCIHDIVELDHLLEIRDILVVHHQDCGKTYMNQNSLNEHLGRYVSEEDKKRHDYEKFDFRLMTKDTLGSSCREDVKFLRDHPWIRPETRIAGYVIDIKTGLLHEV